MKHHPKTVLHVLCAMLVIAGITGVTACAAKNETKKKAIDDQSITDAVEDEFMFHAAVPSDAVTVSTIDGIVTLTGEVDNIMAKERAARIAELVKGVRSVVNNITVDPSPLRTDGAVKRGIDDALAADPATESYEVDASVEDGKVTLTGTVDSWQEKNLAGKVARRVPGVIAVNNDVTVDYESERPDAEIKAEIEKALRWDALVDHVLIDVAVDDGAVELTGTIGSAAEKRQARYDAWVAGVDSVDTTGLQVARWARDEDLRKDKYVIKDDEAVKKAISDALLFDPRTLSFNIDVSVEAGIAKLRGTVDNLKAKKAAGQTARNTVGVTRVKNYLKVRPVNVYESEEIEENVRDALLRNAYVNEYDILVDAAGSTVYLEGEVDSYYEKAEAEEVASTVPGVVTVRNNLEVVYPDTPFTYDPYLDDYDPYDYDWYDYDGDYTYKEDEEIEGDIEDQFFWSPFVDGDEVDVTVEDGVATLTGTVDSYSEREAATENAYQGGAVLVDNDLEVNTGESG